MKRFIYRNILPWIGLAVIKLLSFTCRMKIENPEYEEEIIRNGKRPIYISWHQRFFPGIYFLSKRKPIAIIISLSRDGDFISGIVKILGWTPVRGSSSRGGVRALKEIRRLADEKYSIGHIVDGPRGPFGVVKPGLLMIARTSEMPILPVIFSFEKKWTFKSWDKYMLPKPFSKILVRFGEAIYVPRKVSDNEFEEFRKLIEKKLYGLYEEADKYWSQ